MIAETKGSEFPCKELASFLMESANRGARLSVTKRYPKNKIDAKRARSENASPATRINDSKSARTNLDSKEPLTYWEGLALGSQVLKNPFEYYWQRIFETPGLLL